MSETLDKTETESLESTKDQDFEAEASKMGWVPEDKFRGDKSRWVDAKTFVERGHQVLPIVKAQLRKTEEELAQVRQAAKEFQDFTSAAKEREVGEWKAKYEEALRAKSEALTQGDGDKFIEAEEKQRELEASKPQPKTEPPKVDPAFAAWRADNEWYGVDEARTRRANLIGAVLAADGMKGREFYDAVDAELDRRERDEQGTARTGAQRGGKVAAASKGAHTYENLKPEYKTACDRFVKNLGVKKEDYVAKCGDEAFGS